MTPFCYACGDVGGRVGDRCGRDLAEEHGLSAPFPCRGYYGLPLDYAHASQRAAAETNFYGRGGRWVWKHVDVLGRIVASEPLSYHDAKNQVESWKRARIRELMGERGFRAA